MAADNVIEITEDNWDREVMQSDLPVLVDFNAEWCGPCRVIAPVIEELAGELGGRMKFASVNVDANRDLAARYGVRSIPNLLVIQGGEVKEQMIGAMNKASLSARLAPFV